jgi:redox-sensitive bicupin YhaK (pirin superfamily)
MLRGIRPGPQKEAAMLELVIDQRRRDLGGLEVGRVLPSARRHMVGPFIFFDHMGPIDFPAGLPRSVDIRPHPHIGLATVTYLFDSLGSAVAIRPGEVNWMVAGRGIVHSERFEKARAEGGPLHGVQAWVALPTEHEETSPSFAHHEGGDLPIFEEGGGWGRLIAGRAFGLTAAVHTHSPLFHLHWQLPSGASARLPSSAPERAVYVVSGTVQTVDGPLQAGQMALVAPGGEERLTASTDAVLMMLGGEPIGERFIEWNFVSSSRERIQQAKADWRAERFQALANDPHERMPLPEDVPARLG